MKTLLLIRHAEAGWGDFGLPDVERCLTSRGEKEALAMGATLLAEKLLPDAFMSSTAKRARMSAKLILQGMQTSDAGVIWRDDLYLASAEKLFSVAKACDDSVQTLALLAHNPGLSELADDCLPEPIYGMPPCAVVGITWNAMHWQDISIVDGQLQAYFSP